MALPIHLFSHFCCMMCRLAPLHSVTDRQNNNNNNKRHLYRPYRHLQENRNSSGLIQIEVAYKIA